MTLTPQQRNWLTTLYRHKYMDWWLDTSTGENVMVARILREGEYDNDEQKALNEIVEYYVRMQHVFGTLSHPKL